MVAVVYSLSNREMEKLLIRLKSNLSSDGKIVIVSASFQDNSVSQTLVIKVKDVIKILLEYAGLYERGQFWGWLRSRSEYRTLMKNTGLRFKDGIYEAKKFSFYWITGQIHNE